MMMTAALPRRAVKPAFYVGRALLFACLLALLTQGVMQHWHAPVHLAELVPAAEHDQDPESTADHDCLTCNLLKAGQVAAPADAHRPLSLAVGFAPPVVGQTLSDQRLPQPSARAPPRLSSLTH